MLHMRQRPSRARRLARAAAAEGPVAARHSQLPGPMSLLLLWACVLAPTARACTTIIVGRHATADGSVMIARSDDTGDAHSPNNLWYHAPRDHPALFHSNVDALQLELPGEGLAYIGLPVILPDAAKGRNASGESNGVNSAGVTLSATESIYNSAASLAVDPYVLDTGINEDSIPSIVLPQALSARHAVQVLGGLVQGVGAAEGFGVLFADTTGEAWYLETASGHHWAAVKVPEGTAFVSGNQGRFRDLDLASTDTALSSPGLMEFAINAGLHDSVHHPLDYFKSFMRDIPADGPYNQPRIRAIQALFARGGKVHGLNEPGLADFGVGEGVDGRAPGHATGAAFAGGVWEEGEYEVEAGSEEEGEFGGRHGRYRPHADDMPVWQHPAKRLTVHDVAAAFRIYYKGTPADPYTSQNPNATARPVAVLRTALAHITVVRPQPSVDHRADRDSTEVAGGAGAGPSPLSVVNYLSMGMPLLSPFVPIYPLAMFPRAAADGVSGDEADDVIPAELTGVGHRPDSHSLFWKARRLHALVFQDFPKLAPAAIAAVQEFEAHLDSSAMLEAESAYLSAAAQDGLYADAALSTLTSFSQQVLHDAVRLLEGLTSDAALALGYESVPDDATLLKMLDEAAEAYLYEPQVDTHDSTVFEAAARLHALDAAVQAQAVPADGATTGDATGSSVAAS